MMETATRGQRSGSAPARACSRWGPRTLVVATTQSASHLHRLLATIDPPPRLVGCLVPQGPDADPGQTDTSPIPIAGSLDQFEHHLRHDRIDQVLVSLPLTMQAAIQEVGERCDRAAVSWRFLPTLADQLAGRIDPRRLGTPGSGAAPLDMCRLIDRRPRPLDEPAIRRCLADRVVLITGAGGSIGSELARIVCRFDPAKLVLVERSENALFEIDRELARLHPDLPRAAELHDVTQPAATHALVMKHRPSVIFHAAAHKHVPMMEDHPGAAVENNYFGTRWIADAAAAAGVDRFVMISSDKAVNPSSVMGATKRLAELYVQHRNATSSTIYSMVRFGNVLGSACSVLPIWSEQLARGGPITVTHPDMTRYFMTIPEAAGLVLQAGAQSSGGEVFLLDMGKPVRIVDLAHRFLRAHGFEPDTDIAVHFTGARPGEKLFEELAYDSEDMLATSHASIRIWRTAPPDAAHMAQIAATFERLRNRCNNGIAHPWSGVSREAIVTALRAAVPEMVTAAAG